MPNGKAGDSPLTDLVSHGAHPFPADIEAMLLRIEALGRKSGRHALGENWPFSPMEFQWEKGKDIDQARHLLADLIEMLESGRGDEVLVDPRTRKSFVPRPSAIASASNTRATGAGTIPAASALVASMKWVMLVSGLLTCTMLYAVIAPEAALRTTFGETLEGPLVDVVVRNWAALIVIGGAMLVYGAFHPASRPPVLMMTGLGKLAFIALVFAQGGRYLTQQAMLAVVLDSVMVVLFFAYLAGTRRVR